MINISKNCYLISRARKSTDCNLSFDKLTYRNDCEGDYEQL